MYTDALVLLIGVISSFVGIFICNSIETLVKRKKTNKRYLKSLEVENQKLKNMVNFLSIELQTKEL